MELKVGDRVRYVVKRDIDNVKVGEVGIIRGISPSGNYAVDFEESGYRHNCDGLCQSNHGWWCSGDTLEPVGSKTLRMADGTIIGEFSTGGFCDGFRGGKIPTPSKPVSIEEQFGLPKGVSIHDLPIESLYRPMNIEIQPLELVCDEEQAKNIAERLAKELNGMLGVSFTKKEEKKMPTKFTFYTEEGYRIDKSNNTRIPTMTTEVLINGKNYQYGGSATCDKTDYEEREGVLNAIANAVCGGNFDREFNKVMKNKASANKKSRTCTYCGQVFDTVEEKQAHEAWHVERKKAKRERYLLRKRAKEIAFEEQAQKMAKEMMGEQK